MYDNKFYRLLNIPSGVSVKEKSDFAAYSKAISEAPEPKELLTAFTDLLNEVERFHCYFHFEQSFLYSLSAYALRALGDESGALVYLEKSLFQDRLNDGAKQLLSSINGKETFSLREILEYSKNYKYERDFLKFALGVFNYTEEIKILDEFSEKLFSGREAGDYLMLKKLSYPSHRKLIAQGFFFLRAESYEKASEFFLKGEKLLESAHRKYHSYASSLYASRSRIFGILGEKDLSKNDKKKSLYLIGAPEIG